MVFNIRHRQSISTVVLGLLILFPVSTRAQDAPNAVDPEKVFAQFFDGWDDTKWQHDFRGLKYMRPIEDDGWKIRLQVMQTLVANGKGSLPELERQLGSSYPPNRILSAQAIGYLAPAANLEKLQQAYAIEDDPAARLYLVDAMGMSGKGQQIDWDRFTADEKNRDVLKHIEYAKSRDDTAVEPSVVSALANWDPQQIDTAVEGKSAPDFTLQSVDGQSYQLSQFKGKKPVVLVFIYGDT